MNAHTTIKPPTPAQMRKRALEVVAIAKEAGLDPCSIKVSPDGSIQVFDARAFPPAPRDEFEAWDQAGKLG